MLLGIGGCSTRPPQFRQALLQRACYRPCSTFFSLQVASTRPLAKPRALQLVPYNGHQVMQRRTTRTKTTTKIQNVPQGAIGASALPPQDDATPEYPPLLQEVRNNILKFSHCVLLTRVGGFYEVYLCN